MGLFDPPAVGIRKRTPIALLAPFDNIAGQTNVALADFGASKRAYILGVVMAAWVIGEHRRGSVSLSETDIGYVGTMGQNCSRILGKDALVAASMIEHLVSLDVIFVGNEE